jgi:hypothetical protein
MGDEAMEPYRDRTVGLILFGSVELLLRGCSALLTPLGLLAPVGSIGPALFAALLAPALEQAV